MNFPQLSSSLFFSPAKCSSLPPQTTICCFRFFYFNICEVSLSRFRRTTHSELLSLLLLSCQWRTQDFTLLSTVHSFPPPSLIGTHYSGMATDHRYPKNQNKRTSLWAPRATLNKCLTQQTRAFFSWEMWVVCLSLCSPTRRKFLEFRSKAT